MTVLAAFDLDSDLEVRREHDVLVCADCALSAPDEDFVCDYAREMLAHVTLHVEDGQRVPPRVIDALTAMASSETKAGFRKAE